MEFLKALRHAIELHPPDVGFLLIGEGIVLATDQLKYTFSSNLALTDELFLYDLIDELTELIKVLINFVFSGDPPFAHLNLKLL